MDIDFGMIGLTKIESEIYLEIIKEKGLIAGMLIKKTGFHRATIYSVLNRLIHKGLIRTFRKDKKNYFIPSGSEYVRGLIEEERRKIKKKENEYKSIIKELEKVKDTRSVDESASLFHGKKGVKDILNIILNSKGYLAFTSEGGFKKIFDNYYYLFQKVKKKKKINARILLPEILRNKLRREVTGEIKFLPKEYRYPATTVLCDSKVIFFIFKEPPTAFLIESRELYDSFKSYFEIVWNIARK